MRAVVKSGVGIFSPQGFLDGNNSAAFLSIEDIDTTTKLNADMILVSLKRVIFFNRNGLDAFVKMFAKVRSKNQITVGFCDYDEKKFEAISKFYKDELNFSLFNTQDAAYLFSSSFKNQNKNILLYSEDKSQRAAMAIELHDNGHNPIIAQTQDEFLEKSKGEHAYDVVIKDTFLGQMGQKVATRVTGNAIIYTVSSFLDAEIGNTFNIAYHNNSLNVGFRLFIFDSYKVVSMNVHALNFFSKLASSSAGIGGFAAMKALSTRNDSPKTASRPFDADRDGFVMGEGAAALVLEEYESAVARGATIYGEVIGFGESGDANHITTPSLDGPARAMKAAYKMAGEPKLDYVNAHGTSTPINDKNETAAVKDLLGGKENCPPMSSIKGQIGHCLGAAGGIEAVTCLMAMRDGIIPPTINYTTSDENCDLDYVTEGARKAELNVTMSNSFGFGGTNGVLIFKKI